MKSYKKILTFIMFVMVAFSGYLFGCEVKYDNVKLNSDKEETGLILYLNDGLNQSKPNSGEIIFSVSGLDNGASNIKLSFEDANGGSINETNTPSTQYPVSSIVKIEEIVIQGNTATVRLRAINGGSTKLYAMTEEGNKSTYVQINCVKEVTSMNFASTYLPAMFNQENSKFVIDSTKLIFDPIDTTENQVKYFLQDDVDGVELTESGIITLSKALTSDFYVKAVNVDNQTVIANLPIHLITPLELGDDDGIQFYGDDLLFEDDKLTLTTKGIYSSAIMTLNVNTTEVLSVSYKLNNVSDTITGNADCVIVEQNNLEFSINSSHIGSCEMEITIGFANYSQAPTITKKVLIEVIELPSIIEVNGNKGEFESQQIIYNYYNNTLGKEFVVRIGETYATDKKFILATNKQDKVKIVRGDGREIQTCLLEDGMILGEYEVLENGQIFYISGIGENETVDLFVIANGTIGKNGLLYKTIPLKTSIASTTVKANSFKLDEQDSSICYLELGNTFDIDYQIDNGTSAYGIKLLNPDNSQIEDIIDCEIIENSNKPIVRVTAKSLGTIPCKLILENMVESQVFMISTFSPIEYVDDTFEMGGVFFKVDSPTINRNIANVYYEKEDGVNNTLKDFALALGVNIQLDMSTNPTNATIYEQKMTPVFLDIDKKEVESFVQDGETFLAKNFLAVNDMGNILAKKMFSNEDYDLAIKIEIKSLFTDESGNVKIATATRYITIDTYTQITDVKINKTTSRIYWRDMLNPVQSQDTSRANYQDMLDLTIYPNSIKKSSLSIEWNAPTALNLKTDDLSATITAYNAPNAEKYNIYEVTATIKYYSTTLLRRCVFTVINPTRATNFVANVDDIENKVAYFENVGGQDNVVYTPNSIKINTEVYSASGNQDVDFARVYFVSANEQIATVDENGNIYPQSAGRTTITVYCEDMQPSLNQYGLYKEIEVIVADGLTDSSAIRIRTEKDLNKIVEKPNLHYYLSNDITTQKQLHIDTFSGVIDGNNHTIQGIILDDNNANIFINIAETAIIKNLNIYESCNTTVNSNIDIAGLANKNYGTVENVNIYFIDTHIDLTGNIDFGFAGLINENYGTITSSTVSGEFRFVANSNIVLNSLNISGIVGVNNSNSFVGANNNYQYQSQNLMQTFDFDGKIIVDENISATTSCIGGIVGENNATIGYNNSQNRQGKGFASNVDIMAKGINNVGGIAGVNNGEINNSYVQANITANNNVGGVVGTNKGIITNSIVELNQDITSAEFDKIVANNNVGGIVGYSTEYQVETDENVETKNSSIFYSYIVGLKQENQIEANNNIGGIVGFATNTKIEKSYSNIVLNSLGSNIGGIVGTGSNVEIENAYSLSSSTNQQFVSAIGNVETNSTIKNFYANSNIDFVKEQDAAKVELTNSYNALDSLTNIDTFENWLITNNGTTLIVDDKIVVADWFIGSTENNGYPTLVYENYLMRRLQPTMIDVSLKNSAISNNPLVQQVEGLIVLDINNSYNLSSLLNIATDVVSRASIYVYANNNDVLNTGNVSNILTKRANIYSSSERIVTLTFILGNDRNVQKQVQIAFINRANSILFDTNDVKIQIGENIAINTNINFDEESQSYQVLGNSNTYKLGFNKNDNQILIFDNIEKEISTSDYITFDSQDNNTDFVELLSGNMILNGEVVGKTTLPIDVYYVLNWTDLNGENHTKYIKLNIVRELSIEVYSGAKAINSSIENIDMTLLDDVTFEIAIDTDKSNDKIVINSNSEDIAFELENASNFVKLADDSQQGNENSKLIFTVVRANYDEITEKLVAKFNIRFNEKYVDINDRQFVFNTEFNVKLNFIAESNENLSRDIKISAKPQSLLKIDLTNYPAGRKNSNRFTLEYDTPKHTLTPGQVGLLVVDIYPEFAYFDEIQAQSSMNGDGNYISLIQLAKVNNNEYVELKPNTNTIKNGIILLPYSNFDSTKADGSQFDFDGRFYINTLIGSNVEFNQNFKITINGITYKRDANGKLIENNGQFVVEKQTSKSIDITVNPAPELNIQQQGGSHRAAVYNLNETETVDTDAIYKNLTYIGETLTFEVELKNGLSSTKTPYLTINNKKIENPIYQNGKYIFNFNTTDYEFGDVLYIQSHVEKFVNGYIETYHSKQMTYVVVNKIFTGLVLENEENGIVSFTVNKAELLDLRANSIGNADMTDDELTLLIDFVNKTDSYWMDVNTNSIWQLKETANSKIANSENKYTLLDEFENYNAFNTVEKIDDEFKNQTDLGILVKNKPINDISFKVGFNYYYEFIETENGKELKLVFASKGDKGVEIERTFTMNVSVDSSIDEPIAVYSVNDFYNMQAGLDYILMNDLYFGSQFENVDNEYSNYAETYTPFDLVANSFDGNMYTIHIGDNSINTTGNLQEDYTLFNNINTGTILLNLNVEYGSITIDSNSNVYASTINFAGITVNNNGVVSNCFVKLNGDISLNTMSSASVVNNDGIINIAGFANSNSGKITYSSVYGKNIFENNSSNTILKSAQAGNMSGFVNTNTNLISNCEVKFVGLTNTAHATKSTKVSGFVINNSGNMYNVGAVGQIIPVDFDANLNDTERILALKTDDKRLKSEKLDVSASNLAMLESNGNIAGFVYTNSGEIENAYSSFPMKTQSITAGFVYDNSNAGSVSTSYTASYYAGDNTNNNSYLPFVGADNLGKVLNNAKTSVIKYCYYISNDEEIFEEDVIFKEPASKIAYSLDEIVADSSNAKNQPNVFTAKSYVGFDITSDNDSSTIWSLNGTYMLPTLNSINNNNNFREDVSNFRRPYSIEESLGQPVIHFGRVKNKKVPLQIADAEQFVNVFNEECDWFTQDNTGYVDRNIRLINDIDLSAFAGTEDLNRIRNIVFNGNLDGNGMVISGVKLVGNYVVTNNEKLPESKIHNQTNPYLYTSNSSLSFGLFNQVGTATKKQDDGNYSYNNFDMSTAKINNLTIKVEELSKSTSSFTGILAGVILNTDIKSVKINSNSKIILGRNAVGGLAGGVFGKTSLYNITADASVTSSYQYSANSYYREYGNSNTIEYDNYQFVNYLGYISGYTNLDSDISTSKLCFDERLGNSSYAGGIAGIVDVYSARINGMVDDLYSEDDKYTIDRITSEFRANLDLLTIGGDVNISGEIVGGLFGTTNEDSYINNSTFVVASNNSQKLNGLFAAGGLVGINHGGYIRLSKVEVEQAYVDDYDIDLTNKTGEYLFEGTNYPYAIGGLVGIQYGGVILTSYSKTNVINSFAKYAGGLVGYLTDFNSVYNVTRTFDDIGEEKTVYIPTTKIGTFALLQEVYTTGNVFAGDEITIKEEDGKKIATPNSYVGGIAGKYEPKDIEYTIADETIILENKDTFNGVIGINAFHSPSNYTVSSKYMVKEGSVTKTVKYADIMAGFEATRKLSDGSEELVTFKPRVGSIFGLVSSNNIIYRKAESRYNNLYTSFVYNNKSISTNDGKNENGREIKHIASSFDNVDGFKIDDVDVYDYQQGEKTITVHLNSEFSNTETNTNREDKYLKNFESYFVIKGTGKNSLGDSNEAYRQTDLGIYSGWSDYWIFKNPVYPQLKPKESIEYIDIETADQLKSMRPGNKYRLIKDIYLDETWEATRDMSYITLISATREDGKGVVISGERPINSSYYSIYNIKFNTDKHYKNYGFFKSLNHSVIKNINFVFGTNETNNGEITLTDEFKAQNIVNISGNIENYGLIAGNIISSSVEQIKMFTRNNATENNKVVTENFGLIAGNMQNSKFENIDINTLQGNQNVFDILNISNVGGFVGTAETNNEIVNCFIASNEAICFNIESSEEENVKKSISYGGVAGNANDMTISYSTDREAVNIKVKFDSDLECENVYIGGIIGKFTGELKGASISAKQDLAPTINAKNAYIGGLIGYCNNSSITDVTTKKETNIAINGDIEQNAYVGGAIGYVETSIISAVAINGFNIINQANVDNTTYIGGFAGYANTESITNSFVDGSIYHLVDNTVTKIAGFVATGNLSSQEAENGTEITNSIANTNIITIKNGENISLSGFVVEGISNISNSISSGDIIFAKDFDFDDNSYNLNNDNFEGKVAGFSTSRDAVGNGNYSLATIRLYGEYVRATSFAEKSNISYNYNLSGVWRDTNGINKSYSELTENIKNIKNIDIDNIQKVNRLNPTKFAGYVEKDKYYYLNENKTLNSSIENLENVHIIGNSSTTANVLELASNISVDTKSMISGVILTNKVVEQNDGYIFNTLAESQTDELTGFVKTNNGFINACGTNKVLELENRKQSSAGFVQTNSGLIENSYASTIFHKKGSGQNAKVFGFVQENSGVINNCYSAPSVFDLTDNYIYVYGFANSAQGITNCYYDNTYNLAGSQDGLSKSYADLIETSKEMFAVSESEYNFELNYGYAEPFSYSNSSKDSSSVGYMNTGSNESQSPYIINNAGRYNYLIENKTQNNNFFAKLANDIDFANQEVSSIEFIKNSSLTGIINISNDNLYSLYKFNLKNGSIGLLTASSITANKLGVVGRFNNSTTNTTSGLLVGQANYLTLENCFAILNSVDTIKLNNFGIIAGQVSKSASLKYSFASGDILVESATNVGSLIGLANSATIESTFASGITTIKDSLSGVTNVGGLFGSVNSITSNSNNSYSNVTLEDKTSSNASKLSIGAISGYLQHGLSGQILTNKDISLLDKLFGNKQTSTTDSLAIGKMEIGDFESNDIVKQKVYFDGSKLNPKEFTESTDSFEYNMFYYVNKSLTLTKSYGSSPKMIVGNPNNIQSSKTTLFSGDVYTIISGIDIGQLVITEKVFRGYAYNMVSMDGNGDYGFARTAYKAKFDMCRFSGQCLAGFAKETSETIFKNCSSSIGKSGKSVAGIASRVYGDIYCLGTTKVISKGAATFGGICTTHTSGIIKIDNLNISGTATDDFGGVIGNITVEIDEYHGKLKTSSQIGIVDIDSIVIDNITATNIGGVVGSVSYDSILTNNIDIDSFNSTLPTVGSAVKIKRINTAVNTSINASNFGGFAGKAESVRILGVNIDNIYYMNYGKIDNIGGLVGYSAGCGLFESSVGSMELNFSENAKNIGGLVGYDRKKIVEYTYVDNYGNYVDATVATITTEIDSCHVDKLSLISGNAKTIGGLVGIVDDEINIKNSYVDIFNYNTYNTEMDFIIYGDVNRIYASVEYVGGLVGKVNKCVIDVCHINNFNVDIVEEGIDDDEQFQSYLPKHKAVGAMVGYADSIKFTSRATRYCYILNINLNEWYLKDEMIYAKNLTAIGGIVGVVTSNLYGENIGGDYTNPYSILLYSTTQKYLEATGKFNFNLYYPYRGKIVLAGSVLQFGIYCGNKYEDAILSSTFMVAHGGSDHVKINFVNGIFEYLSKIMYTDEIYTKINADYNDIIQHAYGNGGFSGGGSDVPWN